MACGGHATNVSHSSFPGSFPCGLGYVQSSKHACCAKACTNCSEGVICRVKYTSMPRARHGLLINRAAGEQMGPRTIVSAGCATRAALYDASGSATGCARDEGLLRPRPFVGYFSKRRSTTVAMDEKALT